MKRTTFAVSLLGFSLLCGNAFGASILDISGLGVVTVTETTIDFAPGVLVTNSTDFFSATVPGDTGTIQSLNSTDQPAGVTLTPPLSNFVVLPGYTFDLSLVELPDPSIPVCGGGAASCTPFAGSPFILTQSGGNTAVALSMSGTVTNASNVSAPYMALFTANLTNQTIDQVLGTLAANGSVSSSWSAEFSANAGAVPEPGTSALLVGGVLMLVAGAFRRKKAVR